MPSAWMLQDSAESPPESTMVTTIHPGGESSDSRHLQDPGQRLGSSE